MLKNQYIAYWLYGVMSASLLLSSILHSQSIDFESFKGKPFKVNGGVSANGIFYNSNRDGETRAPFTYNFNGNLVFSLYSFSIPVSYNFTNAGSKLNYSFPFKFNRLSLSPKYKWVRAHIGDVSMTFSPHSLSGMPFTGLGLELTPEFPVNISLMGGRIFKAVPDDSNPQTIPAFKRMGYGTKVSVNSNKGNFGLIAFYAKDDIHSIPVVPDEKGITPKENLVVGITVDTRLMEKLNFVGEFTNSTMTQDLRAANIGDYKGLIGQLITTNGSTENFSAVKVGLDYRLKEISMGVGYERVDPEYQTLGAYYFTNDLENITVNASAPLFKNKLNLNAQIGVQKDNLDGQKQTSTQRLVANISANGQISDQLMANATFSNFSTTTNVNPDQFQAINQEDPEITDIKELNFRQLSKNATLGLNYNFKKQEKAKKNLNFNYAFNQVANEQGGAIRPGQLSSFHNFSTAYNMNFVGSSLSLSAAFNCTLNYIAKEQATTLGPIVTIGKKFLNDQINTQFVTSYNQSSGTSKSQILNLRLSSNYTYKKRHNFNLSATQAFRNSPNSEGLNELTVSLGYSYNFNVGKIQLNRTPKDRQKSLHTENEKPEKDKTKKDKTEKDKGEKTKKNREKGASKNKNKKEKSPKPKREKRVREPKEKPLDNADIIFKALKKLREDANKMSEKFDRRYFKDKYGEFIESVIFSDSNSDEFFHNEYNRMKASGQDFTTMEKLYISHYKMLEIINKIETKQEMIDNEHLEIFLNRYRNKLLEDDEKDINQLEIELANYFFNEYFPLQN